MEQDAILGWSVSSWLEAFGIFAKYEDASVGGADDELFVSIEVERISKEDKKRLKSLGWYADPTLSCFYRFI